MSNNVTLATGQDRPPELPEVSAPLDNSFLSTSETLVVDSDPSSDADSALGVSINGSYSTSLASSIRNYKYENGRRYHAFREGEYPLPNDEPEQDRMDLLHHIWRMMLGGALLRAPISSENFNPQKILDVGTGTGIWAIEMAEEYPNAIVEGTDLSPIQPNWVPSNCKFYVDDAESEWAFSPAVQFDLIHGRSLCGGIADWPKFYSQAYKNLKPGGWLEMQEHEAWLRSDDDTINNAKWTSEWNRAMDDASIKFGKRLNVAEYHKKWIHDAGFVNVEEDVFKIPIGPWAKDRKLKEIGQYHRAEMLDAVEPYTMQLYTRVLGFSHEQTTIVIEGVKAEFRDRKNHLYVAYHFIYGRKPET